MNGDRLLGHYDVIFGDYTKTFTIDKEYQAVTANSRDWHKWKGEMIAYANVVALLEDLKSRAVLIR